MAEDFLTLLDKAVRVKLYYKFKDFMGFEDINKDSMIQPKDIAQRKRAEKEEANKLEFFNLWRNSTSQALYRERPVVAIQGIAVPNMEGAGGYIYKFNSRDLHYSSWFWSEDKDKLNKVESVFSFWNFRDPKLNIMVDTYYPLDMDIMIGDTSYESSGEVQYTKGKIYILRVDFTVEGWILNPEDVKEETAKQIDQILVNISDSTKAPEFVSLSTLLIK